MFWFPTWSDTKNHAVQLQKMARGLKLWIKKVGGSYYLCCENKGADQLHGYREADLRLCFHIFKIWFSHAAAHLIFSWNSYKERGGTGRSNFIVFFNRFW